ncbi:MAG: hypothetical protein VW492_17115, partial [Deltaproteobacteria bacterium]
MIQSFACSETRALFESQVVKKFRAIERVARRKLLMLNAATQLTDLQVPPGNRLEGLQGDLGPANAYGTNRPTAGAYASLDPGWGPDDQRVWITARSPYVQNCTTFG